MITIKELIGKSNAITNEDGLKTYNYLLERLKADEQKIVVCFDGVSIITHRYLSPAIGMLLKDYDIEYMQKRLSFEFMHEHQRHLLNYVIKNSIEHYSKVE